MDFFYDNTRSLRFGIISTCGVTFFLNLAALLLFGSGCVTHFDAWRAGRLHAVSFTGIVTIYKSPYRQNAKQVMDILK